tara:strand:- start:397 stop:786 length:390 start_codon:yes stop_codon:yes gene_type:complete
MKRKYSKKLIWSAIDFVKAANEELGNTIGDELSHAMLDAFDPSLKRQMLMELLLGHNGGSIRIQRDHSLKFSRIEAIKAVRGITHLGLREAMNIIDSAANTVAVIEGTWSIEEYNALANNLIGTGYEVL